MFDKGILGLLGELVNIAPVVPPETARIILGLNDNTHWKIYLLPRSWGKP